MPRPMPRADVDALKKTRVLIGKQQRDITEATLLIADAVADLAMVLPVAKLRGFLGPECGLPKSDVRTLVGLARLSPEERARIGELGIPLSTLKTLVHAEPEVRAHVTQLLAGGTRVDSSGISALRRNRREEKMDPADRARQRHRNFLTTHARHKIGHVLSDFREQYAPFAHELLEFYLDHEGEDYMPMIAEDLSAFRAKCHNLSDTAARAARQFEAIIDVTALPQLWDEDCYTGTADRERLGRAYAALKDISEGKFEPWLGDGVDARGVGQMAGFVDFYYLDAILWLFECNAPVTKKELATPALLVAPARRLRSIELCAGAGGEALGLHSAGFDAAGLFERDPEAVRTLRQNDWLGEVVQTDITTFDFSGYKDIDLVAGGVPCQGHSTAGGRLGRDDERDLFMTAVDIVEQVQPRAFFFENVRGFGQKNNADYRAELHAHFSGLGYESRVFTFTGRDLGLPQLRPRIAFIGFRDGRMRHFRMPPAFPQWASTLGETIGDLVRANNWKHAKAWIKKANSIAPTILGGSHKSSSSGFTPNFVREAMIKLQLDPTKIGLQAPPRGHPKHAPFALTHAMAAQIQGFPDDWQFSGGVQAQKRQIGNALPPIMARAVGLAIHSALTGDKFDYEEALKAPLSRRKTLAQWRETARPLSSRFPPDAYDSSFQEEQRRKSEEDEQYLRWPDNKEAIFPRVAEAAE